MMAHFFVSHVLGFCFCTCNGKRELILMLTCSRRLEKSIRVGTPMPGHFDYDLRVRDMVRVLQVAKH